MDSIHFLNLEYVILRIRAIWADVFGSDAAPAVDPRGYEYYSSGSGAGGGGGFFERAADFLTLAASSLTVLGMVLTVVLTALIVYVLIRLHHVEHEGFHAKEHAHEPHDGPPADSANYRWERVMELVSSPNESDWRRAIVEADIMLGEMLEDRGYVGSTIGDQLKGANPLQFTTLDLAWKAHKVRNDIAHGGESFILTSRDARATIDLYARVFEEFGVL